LLSENTYSIEINELLESLKDRVARQADITVLKKANEELYELANGLEESLWAWRLSSYLTKTSEGADETAKVRKKTENILEDLKKNILEVEEEPIKLDLSSLEHDLNQLFNEISIINDTSSKMIQNFKEEYSRQLEGLKDFSVLLDHKDMKQLSEIQGFIDSFYSNIPSLARISGKTDEILNQKIKDWERLKTSLERINKKLKPESLQAEFAVKEETINILKRLLKGEEIKMSELTKNALLEFKDSQKLSEKIQVRYSSEKR